MARYDWYILRVWQSGGRRSGEQWAARLESMPGGESLRFNCPDLLLEHLQALISPASTEPKPASPEEGPVAEPGPQIPELS